MSIFLHCNKTVEHGTVGQYMVKGGFSHHGAFERKSGTREH